MWGEGKQGKYDLLSMIKYDNTGIEGKVSMLLYFNQK